MKLATKLDGQLWPLLGQTITAGGDSVKAQVLQNLSDAGLLVSLLLESESSPAPRPWLPKLYRKLTKALRRKLRLSSEGVTTVKTDAKGCKRVWRP